jgi:hypothetical protein
LGLADGLLISREAACRRYVELHHEAVAVVFSQNGLVEYFAKSDSFPYLHIAKGNRLPELEAETPSSGVSGIEVVEAEDWLSRPSGFELTAQSLVQTQGWVTTLLHAVALDGDEGNPLEDVFERLSSFSRIGK